MKIQYLGTGAAEGVPALFCNCEYCKALREKIKRGEGGKEVRSRAQILLDGELSIEFPPDAFYHAARFGVDLSAVRYLLVTHSHMDHFYAHDFILHGYKYAHEMTSPRLSVYGNAEVREVFRECTRREMKPEVASTMDFFTVRAFEEVAFGDWRAFAFPAHHSSREPLLWLVEKDGKRVLHLTDTGRIPDESMNFLKLLSKHVDLITLDCTFLWENSDPNARHMNLKEAAHTVERLTRAGICDERTVKVITHFSHNSAPSVEALERAEKEYGFVAAYDGMELEI